MAQVPDALTALHARAPMIWFVRTGGEPVSLSAVIQRVLREASGGVPVARTAVRAMDDVIAESISRPHFNMQLMTIFAAAALLLAAMGVYGVISYSVQERTREIGIRVALGGRATEVRNMILLQGMRIALVGVGIGLVAALSLARVIASFLFGVTARDPVVFTVVPIVLASVALVAVWLPALRATRVDPMVALRHE
jgi:putative ABC transport system permease protein